MTILITGAAGLNGTAAVREFARHGEPIRALVRNRAQARELVEIPIVELVEGDMLLPETLGPALDGVDRVLLISSTGPRMAETQCAFIDAAKKAGVGRVVKFSGLNAAVDSAFRFTRMHGEIERHLERSGLAWTHLRPSQFMQVYFREVQTIVNEDAFYLPMGDERLAPVDVADIAKVARLLLREGGHDDQSYDMTGPEALTMPEIAQRISDAVGRSIRYVDIDPDEEPNRPCVSTRTNGSASGPPCSPSSPPATRPCSGESPARDHTCRTGRWPTEPRATLRGK